MLHFMLIAGFVLAIAVLMLLSTYNSLMDQRQAVRTAWAQMDERFKQRYDLVPAMLVTVSQIGGETAAKLPAITTAKNQAAVAFNPTQLATAESALTLAIQDLLATTGENPAFADLRKKLLNSEMQVDKARQHYNEQVQQLNDSMATFPTAVTAKLIGMKRQPSFELRS